MAKPHGPFGPYQITRVRLGSILEQDVFTARLLASQQYETDVAVDLECWDAMVTEVLAVRSLPILVRRLDSYQYLGSGHAVRLLQQIFDPDDEVQAIVLDTRRVSNKIKLNVLACDLLLAPLFFRTRPLLPRQKMRLWEAIGDAGGTPIRGKGLHAFARATGYSHNALKDPNRKKSASPRSRKTARVVGPSATEGEE